MAEENFTKRKICPFISKPMVRELVGPNGEPPGIFLRPAQCIGHECQMWAYDERMPPETGNCALPLAAVFGGTAAIELSSVVNNIGVLSQQLAIVMRKFGLEFPSEPAKPQA